MKDDTDARVPHDLMYGITPVHIRRLVDPPEMGGRGKRIEDVRHWTPDQVWFHLCNVDNLRSPKGRIVRTRTGDVSIDKNGFAKGRSIDGKPIKAKIAGKSLAQRIREQKQQEQEKRESSDVELTDVDRQYMETLSPKQQRKFLKRLKNGT